MEREIKTYRVKICPTASQRKAMVNVSLLRNQKFASKSKTFLLTHHAINVFFEPPILARFIQLEANSDKTKISLCEVEAYGTGAYPLHQTKLRLSTRQP